MKYRLMMPLLLIIVTSSAMDNPHRSCPKICNLFSKLFFTKGNVMERQEKPVTQILQEQMDFEEHFVHINPVPQQGLKP